jgi:4-hydroxythreonine-4-phosphate dehydrogenase
MTLSQVNGAAVWHLEALRDRWEPGVVSASTGQASYCYVTAAIEAALSGQVGAVVTGPIHKEALRQSGVQYPGHTEIFEALTKSNRACMMLTSDALTCSFVTTHVGLGEVPGLLTTERVLDVIELTDEAIRRMKGRSSRLVICGLNPHAGENGLFGNREEERIIVPAIDAARHNGIEIDGPLPPDTAFLPERRKRTDAFVCMYHDQGHIPLKALSFETAVNTTLGLPIVRTSVDHGTALDIAWKSFCADATSMIQAIRLANQLISHPIPSFSGAMP